MLLYATGVLEVARVDTTCTSCRLTTLKLSLALVCAKAFALAANRKTAADKFFYILQFIRSLRRHYPVQVLWVCSQPVMLRHPLSREIAGKISAFRRRKQKNFYICLEQSNFATC